MHFLLSIVVSLVGVVASLAAFIVFRFRAPPVPKGIPTVPRKPIIGSFNELPRFDTNFFEWYVDLMNKYGNIISLSYFGNRSPTILTTDPKILEHVLKTNFDNYEKGSALRARQADLLGNGIFAADGDNWYQQRKVASHIFSVNNFKLNMMVVFKHHGQTLVKILDAVKPGEVVDIQNLFFRFTLASFCQIAFGFDIGAMEKDVPFGKAFDNAQAQTASRCFTPFWAIVEMFSKKAKDNAKGIRMLNEFAHDVIRKRREQIAQDPTGVNDRDLLGLFLAVKDDHGQPLSDSYLRDVIMNFILAGRDTTAGALSACIWELTSNKDVEAKMVAEMRSLFPVGEHTYENMQKLPYTQAVISETLRLHPSVPIDTKISIKEDVLPGDIHIKAGTYVNYIPYAMGRDPKRYPDPLKFDPERFVHKPATSMSMFEYPVFNAGPRTCLGINMAHLEMKAVLSEILPRYDIRVVPGASDQPRFPALTLSFQHGLPVTITPQKH